MTKFRAFLGLREHTLFYCILKHTIYEDFDLYSKDIFPKELTLNKANTDNKHCPFFDLEILHMHGVYISQLVRFARVCSNVSDFNERNLFITDKLLHQGFRYHKLVKTFTQFYYRYRFNFEIQNYL